MGKNICFPILLIICAIVLSSTQEAFAALSASQTVTGVVPTVKVVATNGGNIAAVIDPTTGTLSAALTPGFTLTTNTNAALPLTLSVTVNTSGGSLSGLFGTGATGSTFILLTNSTVLPTPAAVVDASSGAPTPASNANVIAYPVDAPADIPGQLVYTWDALNTRWNGSLTHKITTNTLLTIPASAPKANTFSIDDADGSYQATVTLSFV